MKELLSRYKRDLALRGYSPRIQDHYFRNAKQFLSFYDLPEEQLDTEKIKDYLYYLLTEKKASDSKIRQAHGSVKYLFTQTLSRSWEVDPVPQMSRVIIFPGRVRCLSTPHGGFRPVRTIGRLALPSNRKI